MMIGDNSAVRSMTSKFSVDDLSRLYNDKKTAIAAGSMANHFELRDGKSFDLDSRWTAALVKEEGKWRIVAFHISTNMFDNGVLSLYLRQALLYTCIGVGFGGLVVGFVAGRLLPRRQTPPQPAV
jgi:hypothetical protein